MNPTAYRMTGEDERTVLEEIIAESLHIGCCPTHRDVHEDGGPCCIDEPKEGGSA